MALSLASVLPVLAAIGGPEVVILLALLGIPVLIVVVVALAVRKRA